MMRRELRFQDEAEAELDAIRRDPSKRGLLKQVRKTLGLLETNLQHPSLHTHKYQSLTGPNGEEVFEAYVQNRTPGAYRIFFCYGPDELRGGHRVPVLTIIAITEHP